MSRGAETPPPPQTAADRAWRCRQSPGGWRRPCTRRASGGRRCTPGTPRGCRRRGRRTGPAATCPTRPPWHGRKGGPAAVTTTGSSQAPRDAPRDKVAGDVVGDAGVDGRDDLRAVFPVDLVAVVLLGVVRRGHHDARLALEVRHGKGQVRRRADAGKEVHAHALEQESRRRALGKLAGMVPRVVPNDDRHAVAALAKGLEHVGAQALRAPAHNGGRVSPPWLPRGQPTPRLTCEAWMTVRSFIRE